MYEAIRTIHKGIVMIIDVKSTRSHIVAQYLIFELVGDTQQVSDIFGYSFYDHKEDAFKDIADRGERTTRYTLLETYNLFTST